MIKSLSLTNPQNIKDNESMSRNLNALVCPLEEVLDNPVQNSHTEKVIEFYEEAGMDYEHWSKGFNMHMGFYRWGLNPFDREKMLEQLNREVAARLELDSKSDHCSLIWLRCGRNRQKRRQNFSRRDHQGRNAFAFAG